MHTARLPRLCRWSPELIGAVQHPSLRTTVSVARHGVFARHRGSGGFYARRTDLHPYTARRSRFSCCRDGCRAPRERPAFSEAELTSADQSAHPGVLREQGAAFSLSCVILTQGNRPAELNRAIDSVRAQQGPNVEVVLVVNGGVAPQVPIPSERVIVLPHNVGVPAGRNAGLTASTGEVIVFIDDDGWLPDRGTANRIRAAFAARPELGILSFRIVDPETGQTARRHIPRARVGNPERSSQVTTFLGGACAIRRAVFDRCGHLPAAFFYSHEETDLAWRALDAGFEIYYDAGAIMYHPGGIPYLRHVEFFENHARNRVWLARRRLPTPLIPLYLGTWIAITVLRHPHAQMLRASWRGFLDGWRTDPGPRRPIRWPTVWTMTRLGRPPVI
jgi:GT2 family glycosyltransferase